MDDASWKRLFTLTFPFMSYLPLAQFHFRVKAPLPYGIKLWNLVDMCYSLRQCVINTMKALIFSFLWQKLASTLAALTYGIHFWKSIDGCSSSRWLVMNKMITVIFCFFYELSTHGKSLCLVSSSFTFGDTILKLSGWVLFIIMICYEQVWQLLLVFLLRFFYWGP